MEGKVLIDSNIVVDYLNDKLSEAYQLEYLISKELAVFSVVSIFEVYCGVKDIDTRGKVMSIFEGEKILSLSIDSVWISSRIFNYVSKELRLSIGDILVAGQCISNNLKLWTNNRKHFDRIEGLEFYGP
ncbi:MAG: type II toxin-antitoxin system VapC family toxin [Actinobacteria bacterium]|nr:type II toxin-antitoxin system VapC family toxin [Actinomycetota bacterium]